MPDLVITEEEIKNILSAGSDVEGKVVIEKEDSRDEVIGRLVEIRVPIEGMFDKSKLEEQLKKDSKMFG